MTRYKHPRAVGADDPPQIAVDIDGTHYTLDSEGCFECDNESGVRKVARSYDMALSDLRLTETCDAVKTDGEVCGRELPCPYHSE